MIFKKSKKQIREKGFVILIAVLVSSLLISIGTFISVMALKEIRLSSSSKDSQTAFYAADSAIECALYHDFRSANGPFPSNQSEVDEMGNTIAEHVNCNGQDWDIWHSGNAASSPTKPNDIVDISSNEDESVSYFEVSFARAGQGEDTDDQPYARVRIYKNSSIDKTVIQVYGHNKKVGQGIVERGLEVSY